jgi:hypothetical protein
MNPVDKESFLTSQELEDYFENLVRLLLAIVACFHLAVVFLIWLLLFLLFFAIPAFFDW